MAKHFYIRQASSILISPRRGKPVPSIAKIIWQKPPLSREDCIGERWYIGRKYEATSAKSRHASDAKSWKRHLWRGPRSYSHHEIRHELLQALALKMQNVLTPHSHYAFFKGHNSHNPPNKFKKRPRFRPIKPLGLPENPTQNALYFDRKTRFGTLNIPAHARWWSAVPKFVISLDVGLG